MPLAATAQLVVNEVDYDQPGTDSSEFVEILNHGDETVDLGDYRLDLINGSTGQRYDSITLPPELLAPSDYFVVCTDRTHVRNCSLEIGPQFHLIENGAPDAVAILLGGSIVDTLSYEGDTTGYTEGRGTEIEDPSDLTRRSLSRFPNGHDTDNNFADFDRRCISPGEPNSPADAGCGPDGLELTVSGDCPGTLVLHVEGGSGGGSGALLAGPTLGDSPIGGGPCAGIPSDLESPQLATTFVFDEAGVIEIERIGTEAQCGWRVQILDLSTCTLSETAELGL